MRGTTNGNVRGSNQDRRARRAYLVLVYESDRGPGTCRCFRCGRVLRAGTLTVDRIVPGCRGGTYRRDNIRPACARCNSQIGGRCRAARALDAARSRGATGVKP